MKPAGGWRRWAGRRLPLWAQVLRGVGAALLLLAAAVLAWSAWPHRVVQRSLAFSEQKLTQSGLTPAQQDLLAGYQLEQFTLARPALLRIGEAGTITLSVSPASDVPSPANPGEPGLASKSRLDLVGVEHIPQDVVRTALPRGKGVSFSWQVRPAQAGDYAGTAWFYVVFPAQAGAKTSPAPVPLTAQDFTLRVVAPAGLTLGQVRGLGLAGFALGVFILFIVVIKS